MVTVLPSTTRNIRTGMMEMGDGDTNAVLDAFNERIHNLATTLQTIYTGEAPDDVHKELVTTVKSTMTDQGPTMPQFNERLQSVRTSCGKLGRVPRRG